MPCVSSGGSQSISKPPYYSLLPVVQGFKLVSSPPDQVRREKVASSETLVAGFTDEQRKYAVPSPSLA